MAFKLAKMGRDVLPRGVVYSKATKKYLVRVYVKGRVTSVNSFKENGKAEEYYKAYPETDSWGNRHREMDHK